MPSTAPLRTAAMPSVMDVRPLRGVIRPVERCGAEPRGSIWGFAPQQMPVTDIGRCCAHAYPHLTVLDDRHFDVPELQAVARAVLRLDDRLHRGLRSIVAPCSSRVESDLIR